MCNGDVRRKVRVRLFDVLADPLWKLVPLREERGDGARSIANSEITRKETSAPCRPSQSAVATKEGVRVDADGRATA